MWADYDGFDGILAGFWRVWGGGTFGTFTARLAGRVPFARLTSRLGCDWPGSVGGRIGTILAHLEGLGSY